jgi:hypothetical protein
MKELKSIALLFARDAQNWSRSLPWVAILGSEDVRSCRDYIEIIWEMMQLLDCPDVANRRSAFKINRKHSLSP